MQTRNQISLTRKTLYAIMLLAVFLSAFGAGNIPSARAQESPAETPTELVTPTETPAPTENVDEKIASTDTTMDVFSLSATCDPQVYYGVQHCTDGTGTHYISINLNDSHVRFQTVLSSGPNGECNSVNHNGKDPGSNCPNPYPFEKTSSMLSRYKSQGAVAVINTDYFGTNGDHGAQGLAVRNGSRLDGPAHGVYNDLGYNQPSLAISPSRSITIGIPGSQNEIDSNLNGKYYNAVGGAPIIVSGGQAVNSSCTYPYPGSTCSSTAQSAAGITSDGRLILLTATKNASAMASYLISNFGVHTAIKFDGGGSARIAWLDSGENIRSWGVTGEDRAIAEGLLIFSTKIGGPDPSGNWQSKYTEGDSCWWDTNCSQFNGTAVPKCEANIAGPELHKDWGTGAPCGGMSGDNWVGNFMGTINFPSGNYVFHLDHDDGAKFWLNGENKGDFGGSGNNTICNGTGGFSLSGNQSIRAMIREQGGDAKIHLTWDTNTSVCAPPPAPSANFDAWDLSGTAPFTTAMHIIDTSNITSCSWNYGDGQTGTSCASSHNHTYNTAGNYTVSLTVSGPGGSDSMTRANYISVTASGDSYEPDDSSGLASLISSGSTQTHNIIPVTDVDWVKFQLTNPSAITLDTTGPTGYDTRMWLYNSSLGQIDYSDDEGVDNYSLIDRQCGVDALPAGMYYVKVDDFNNDNTIPSYNLSFNITQNCTPPSANFDAWPWSGNAPFTTAMHIVDTSYITSCSWNYGDGQTGTSCASLHDHTYNNAGTYTVSLTVSGPGGSDSMTRTNYITVSAIPRAPTNFTITGTTNNSIALTWQDNSNNETGFKIYRWDFVGSVWEFYLYAQTGANVNSYTNTSLSCEKDYYYQVSAYNAQGESERAGWVKGTTAACPQSELSIASITFDPASPFSNDDVWVKIVIQNTSNVPTAGFWTDFYVDDTPTGCSDWGSYWGWSESLAANSTFTWWTRLPANSLTTGTHQFRAYIDSGCKALETNENNNIGTASFTLTAQSSAAPAHDDFDNARLISPIPYTDILNVSGATTASDDPYVPNCNGQQLAPGMTSVWYKYTPTTNTKVYLDTFGSSYDTYIAAWSGTRGALSPIGCNDDYDHAGGNYQSGLEVQLTANTIYYFQVAQFSDSTAVSSASISSLETALVLPPGASSTESASQTRKKSNTEVLSMQAFGKTMKGNSDVGAQAGGTLQFHVRFTGGSNTLYLPLIKR